VKPRKKFRGKRRYFRNLHRRAARFRIDLRESHWYDLWHEHFDFKGHGRFSVRHRREHLAALFVAFYRAGRQAAESGRPAQVFLSIAPRHRAEHDAIYVHTPNPNGTAFPYAFNGVRWGIPAPDLLRPFISDEWEVGEILRSREPGWLAVRPRTDAEPREPRIAFDSQAVIYFLRANRGEEFPPRSAELSDHDRQHIATIRLAMAYYPIVVPTAEAECLAVADDAAAEERWRFFCSFFLQANNLEGTDVEGRAKRFMRLHAGEGDCRIVAEAICEGADVLVTDDRRLQKRLSTTAAPLLLLTPAEAWERFPKPPDRVPARATRSPTSTGGGGRLFGKARVPDDHFRCGSARVSDRASAFANHRPLKR
jgi:hypothetical protein